MVSPNQQLNDIIERSGYKRQYLAEQLGISSRTLNNKIAGRTEFVASEIGKLSSALGLSDYETGQIFFAYDRDKESTKN